MAAMEAGAEADTGPGDSVEVVRRWFEAMGRGDLGEELWDPGLRIENAAGWVIATTYSGHDGLRQWWSDLAEAFSDFRLELEELTPVDDARVLSTQRFRGHFRATGIEMNGLWASVTTVRNGRIVKAAGYFSKAAAMRAVGGSE
jgi:ketosteroid isomerase-like protein